MFAPSPASGFARARKALLAVALGAVLVPAFAAGEASAIAGNFCGTAGSPTPLAGGQSCTGSAYHSNYSAMAANAVSGSNACVARSSTPGALTVVEVSCSGSGAASTWNCTSAPCPGYGSVWKQSAGSGQYYGWYSYS